MTSKERVAFEAWLKDNHWSSARNPYDRDRYQTESTSVAWQAWQARAAYSADEPAPAHTGQTITATHDETGRWWRGPRGALPKGYTECLAQPPCVDLKQIRQIAMDTARDPYLRCVDIAMLVDAAKSTAPPPGDGPFQAFYRPRDNTRGVIDERAGDTKLIIVGEFKDEDDHREYCERIAAMLNRSALTKGSDHVG